MSSRLLAIPALCLATFTLCASSALAGSYQVSACRGAAMSTNNSWIAFNSSPAYLEAPSHCGSAEVTGGSAATSGLAAADVLELSSNVPAGAVAGWRFSAPAGDTISAITMNRDLYEQSEGWAPQIIEGAGKPLPGQSCPFNASSGGCESTGPVSLSGLATSSLAIELLCAPEAFSLSACANGFSEHDGRAELGSATVTITDEQPPKITSLSGSLFAGGLARATLAGTVEATDNSGVLSAGLYVDGAPSAQQTFACDFTRPAPCPASATAALSLDTSKLSNGAHQIQADVVDAAGNQTISGPIALSVENSSPGSPTGLLANGAGAGAWFNGPVTISWANPSQPPDDPISQVNWIACAGVEPSVPAGGCGAQHNQATPLSSLRFNPAEEIAFAAQPQGTYTVFVWLQDALGNTAESSAGAIGFGYQTSPPPPPRSISSSGSGPYTIALLAASHPAPITAVHWIACKLGGGCTATETSAALTFQFAPSETSPFKRSPYGKYEIRAWLKDAAGNSDSANSATLALLHLKPKRQPRLHIAGARMVGRALRIRGSAAPALAGLVTIIVYYGLHGRVRKAVRSVRVAHGRWHALVALPHSARPRRFLVIRRASARWRTQRIVVRFWRG